MASNNNNVSQPPLNIQAVDGNGRFERVWAIWFRDVYKRIGYKGGNAIDEAVVAGYGGIGVEAVKAIGTINSTFQTLEGFDIDLIETPLDVTYDKANHGLKLDRQGVWEFVVKVALTFDELNSGREIQLRSYNSTASIAGTVEFNYFIGRNQGGVNIPLVIAVDVLPANVGDLIQLQIGSASDTFANSSNIGTIYQVKHISERRDDSGA